MKISLLDDPRISPLPTYTAADARRALEGAGFEVEAVTLAGLAGLSRRQADALVLPYRDGDMSGGPLEGLIRFHSEGGGLLFLGDTPHVGRSYPYRNSQAPDLRLTRCRDPLQIRGLTEMGRKILGDLPDWEGMLKREMRGCVRTSAFAPDECHNLLECEQGVSQQILTAFRHRFQGVNVRTIWCFGRASGMGPGGCRCGLTGITQKPG